MVGIVVKNSVLSIVVFFYLFLKGMVNSFVYLFVCIGLSICLYC